MGLFSKPVQDVIVDSDRDARLPRRLLEDWASLAFAEIVLSLRGSHSITRASVCTYVHIQQGQTDPTRSAERCGVGRLFAMGCQPNYAQLRD
jgi:hypothetical protein